MIFKGLWQRLSRPKVKVQPRYDAVYGLPRKAVAEWLEWNPQLKAEHERLEVAAERKRDHRNH